MNKILKAMDYEQPDSSSQSTQPFEKGNSSSQWLAEFNKGSALMNGGQYYEAAKHFDRMIVDYENGKVDLSKPRLPGLDEDFPLNLYFMSSGCYLFMGLTEQSYFRLKQNEYRFQSGDLFKKATFYISLLEACRYTHRDTEFFINAEKARATLESMKNLSKVKVIQKNSSLIQYHRQVGRFHFDQYNYTEAIPHLKEAAILYNEMNTMNPSMKSINEIHTVDNPLIISLIKAGEISTAKSFAKNISEKAVYAHLTDNPEEALKQYRLFYQKYAQIGTFMQMQVAEPTGYFGLLALQNSPDALPEIQQWLSEKESVFSKDFINFSEKEKREFLKKYSTNLNLYYSILLHLAKPTNDNTVKVLEKSLQTKGLIFDLQREQEMLRKKMMADPLLKDDVIRLKKYRSRLAAFNQQSNPYAALLGTDSSAYYSARISELERSINEKTRSSKQILQPVSWKSIQSKLTPAEAYVEIVKIDRDNFLFDKPVAEYYAFIIKPGMAQPKMIKIGAGEDIEGKPLVYYQNCIRSQIEDRKSYTTYWASIQESLEGTKKIYFSADGIYHILNPLAFLHPQRNEYMADVLDIVRLSTGREFKSIAASQKAASITLVGNPDFEMKRKEAPKETTTTSFLQAISDEGAKTRSGFMVLPGTKKEIDLIASRSSTSGLTVKMLQQKNASEVEVKKIINPAVLHIATHGEFTAADNLESYLQSKLILAGAADKEPLTFNDYELYDDGFLTSLEVIQLSLTETQLVVLSACETGLGEVQSGEGVWGLQRAFQMAGARAVLGSLWKISDEATVVFMDSFYKNYLSGKNIHQAYAAAIADTRKEYPYPYYWAAFTLIGEN